MHCKSINQHLARDETTKEAAAFPGFSRTTNTQQSKVSRFGTPFRSFEHTLSPLLFLKKYVRQIFVYSRATYRCIATHNMVAFHALAGLLALASPLLVLADVNPSEPGPGSIFRAGSKCRVTWQGDTDSTTAWKDMAIELMSGSNLNMVPVTSENSPAVIPLSDVIPLVSCRDQSRRYQRRQF